MKNFGLFILGVIVGAVAVYFYCCQGDSDIVEAAEIVAPKGLIKPNEADSLDIAYNLRHKIISDSLFKSVKSGDNRSSWWSLEDIQNYINYAENQAGELGYTMDGLRLYLGAYPTEDGQAGFTTMFFIPTGTLNKAQGSLLFTAQGGSNDIQGADGLNKGTQGYPPGANYPQ